MSDYKYYKRRPALAPWKKEQKTPYSVLLPVCVGGTVAIAVAFWHLADSIGKMIA